MSINENKKTTWMIHGVDEELKNRFVGIAKTRGENVGDEMNKLLKQFFSKSGLVLN